MILSNTVWAQLYYQCELTELNDQSSKFNFAFEIKAATDLPYSQFAAQFSELDGNELAKRTLLQESQFALSPISELENVRETNFLPFFTDRQLLIPSYIYQQNDGYVAKLHWQYLPSQALHIDFSSSELLAKAAVINNTKDIGDIRFSGQCQKITATSFEQIVGLLANLPLPAYTEVLERVAQINQEVEPPNVEQETKSSNSVNLTINNTLVDPQKSIGVSETKDDDKALLEQAQIVLPIKINSDKNEQCAKQPNPRNLGYRQFRLGICAQDIVESLNCRNMNIPPLNQLVLRNEKLTLSSAKANWYNCYDLNWRFFFIFENNFATDQAEYTAGSLLSCKTIPNAQIDGELAASQPASDPLSNTEQLVTCNYHLTPLSGLMIDTGLSNLLKAKDLLVVLLLKNKLQLDWQWSEEQENNFTEQQINSLYASFNNGKAFISLKRDEQKHVHLFLEYYDINGQIKIHQEHRP